MHRPPARGERDQPDGDKRRAAVKRGAGDAVEHRHRHRPRPAVDLEVRRERLGHCRAGCRSHLRGNLAVSNWTVSKVEPVVSGREAARRHGAAQCAQPADTSSILSFRPSQQPPPSEIEGRATRRETIPNGTVSRATRATARARVHWRRRWAAPDREKQVRVADHLNRHDSEGGEAARLHDLRRKRRVESGRAVAVTRRVIAVLRPVSTAKFCAVAPGVRGAPPARHGRAARRARWRSPRRQGRAAPRCRSRSAGSPARRHPHSSRRPSAKGRSPPPRGRPRPRNAVQAIGHPEGERPEEGSPQAAAPAREGRQGSRSVVCAKTRSGNRRTTRAISIAPLTMARTGACSKK